MNFCAEKCLEICPFASLEGRAQGTLAERIDRLKRQKESTASIQNSLDRLSQDLGTVLISHLDQAGLEDDELFQAQLEREVTEKLESIESATDAKGIFDAIDAEIAKIESEIADSRADQARLVASCLLGPKTYKDGSGDVVCRSRFKAEYLAKKLPQDKSQNQ